MGPQQLEAARADICFIIHPTWRIRDSHPEINIFGRLRCGGTCVIVDNRARPFFYVRAEDAAAVEEILPGLEVAASSCDKRAMDGGEMARVEFSLPSHARALREALDARGVRTYEADIPFARRHLIDHQLRGVTEVRGPWQPGRRVDRIYTNPELVPAQWEPELATLSFDLETDPEAARIYAVSLVAWGPDARHNAEEILVVGEPTPGDPPAARCFRDERSLLLAFIERIGEIDPDLLTGWNVIDFDMAVLERRCAAHNVTFNLGRTERPSRLTDVSGRGVRSADVEGRQVLDGLRLMRASLHRFEDFRLDTVARAVLGRGKTLAPEADEEMPETITRAYQEDRSSFCEYCLEDARLVRDILLDKGLLKLTVRRSLLIGTPLQRSWASVVSFDFLYLSELHARGMVAPTTGTDRPGERGVPGGAILEPQPGLASNVLVFDYKSLYPSVVRTFNIDPLTYVRDPSPTDDLITAPNGAHFRREPGILPGMLDRFFASRERARAEGDEVASTAYKIIMNSFYGVLATDASRFSSSSIAGAITSFGQHVLRWTQDLLEADGLRVLYGDTDSLFVDAGLPKGASAEEAHRRGAEMAASVNRRLAEHVRSTHGVESRLEIEFEKHYRRFFLPTTRGSSERGRAKGYAGLRVDAAGEALDIVGMEAVRRDWTPVAQEFQRGLLARVFHDAPAAEIREYIARVVGAVRSGRMDDELVYRKSLRKPVEEYTKTRPPHVQAASLLPRPGGVIRYLMTTAGPQPEGHLDAPIDYKHYIRKQLRPIAESIGDVIGMDVGTTPLGNGQLRLF